MVLTDSASMPDPKLKQSDLLYDYIKFHIGLYLATPAGFALIGQALGIQCRLPYQIGLGLMVLAYLLAGAKASVFVAHYLFKKWDNLEPWKQLGTQGDVFWRKFFHHYLYWIGLVVAVIGGIFSLMWIKTPHCS